MDECQWTKRNRSVISRFVKAEYQLAKTAGRSPRFEVSFRPLAGGPTTFAVAEKNGERFSAELDVLAALVRARVIRQGSMAKRNRNLAGENMDLPATKMDGMGLFDCCREN